MRRRTSSRNNSLCSNSGILLAPLSADSRVLQQLPPDLAQKLPSLAPLSCRTVSQLPLLEMPSNLSAELLIAQNAAKYQQDWARNLLAGQPDNASSMGRANEDQPKRYGSIWEDPDFLERLNDYLYSRSPIYIRETGLG